MKTKKELRKEVLQKRDALSIEERREKSKKITEQITSQEAFAQADVLLLFASYKSEVDTKAIFETAIEQKKEVYYPKIIGKEMEFYRVFEQADLAEEVRGIREPLAIEENRYIPSEQKKVCVIMPGAVFDMEGNRIGYGGGYYDKYLKKLEAKMPKEMMTKLAIAFDCQLVEIGKILSEEHDRKPDFLVTESRIYHK